MPYSRMQVHIGELSRIIREARETIDGREAFLAENRIPEGYNPNRGRSHKAGGEQGDVTAPTAGASTQAPIEISSNVSSSLTPSEEAFPLTPSGNLAGQSDNVPNRPARQSYDLPGQGLLTDIASPSIDTPVPTRYVQATGPSSLRGRSGRFIGPSRPSLDIPLRSPQGQAVEDPYESLTRPDVGRRPIEPQETSSLVSESIRPLEYSPVTFPVETHEEGPGSRAESPPQATDTSSSSIDSDNIHPIEAPQPLSRVKTRNVSATAQSLSGLSIGGAEIGSSPEAPGGRKRSRPMSSGSTLNPPLTSSTDSPSRRTDSFTNFYKKIRSNVSLDFHHSSTSAGPSGSRAGTSTSAKPSSSPAGPSTYVAGSDDLTHEEFGLGAYGRTDEVSNTESESEQPQEPIGQQGGDNEEQTQPDARGLKTWTDVYVDLYANTDRGDVAFYLWPEKLKNLVKAACGGSTKNAKKIHDLARREGASAKPDTCLMTTVIASRNPARRLIKATENACETCLKRRNHWACITFRRAGGFYMMPRNKDHRDINNTAHWI
ncbi:hypothetical protein IWX49DRAFT_554183 [Phyllosticta citricarpa]|uniref:Uncharacterized protein n=1 Tax=Phyllosticta citricarpa TaxID=55181 RepID=A0ABR1M7B7_9PEZI